MKIAHEAPLSVMSKVQELTDYDYCLVHMMYDKKIGPQYRQFFVDALKNGREVMLDNSIFELGESYNMEDYYNEVKSLQPTYYIIPDVLEDAQGTIDNLDKWIELTGGKVGNSLSVAVAQGNTYEEVKRCYLAIKDRVDVVAFSFDCSFLPNFGKTYWKGDPDVDSNSIDGYTEEVWYSLGRVAMLMSLIKEGVIDYRKPHHLLGCYTPQEMTWYNSADFSFIRSVDTSNPVLHGWKGIAYEPEGLTTKIMDKMCKIMSQKEKHWDIIEHNIKTFRSFTQL